MEGVNKGEKKKKEKKSIFSYKIIIALQGGRCGGPGKFKKKNAGGPVFLLEDEVEDDM